MVVVLAKPPYQVGIENLQTLSEFECCAVVVCVCVCVCMVMHQAMLVCTCIDLFGANSHLVQSQLKVDVTPIITYMGYTPWWERTTVTQSL